MGATAPRDNVTQEDALHLFAAILLATTRAGRGGGGVKASASGDGTARVGVVHALCVYAVAQLCLLYGGAARARRRRHRRPPFRSAPQGVCVGALLPLALSFVPGLARYEATLVAASYATIALCFASGSASRTVFAVGIATLLSAYRVAAGADAWIAGTVPLIAALLLHAAPRTFTVAEAALVASGAVSGLISHSTVTAPTITTPTTVAAVGAVLCGAHAVGVHRWPRLLYFTPLTAIAPTYMLATFTLPSEPITWTINYISHKSRFPIFIFWSTLLASTLTLPPKMRSLHRIAARKLYHVIITAVFLPALAIDPEFLAFAALAALAVLTLAEAVRQTECAAARALDTICRPLLDARDAGAFAVTHIYLLAGCAAPLWISGPDPRFRARAAAGLITVGVQDAVAAVVGRKYGTTKWPAGQGRSVQGSIAGALAAWSLAIPWTWYWNGNILAALIATSAAALLEAHSTQIDNLVLPLYYIVVYEAVAR